VRRLVTLWITGILCLAANVQEASACSCVVGCQAEIYVGQRIPENFTGIGYQVLDADGPPEISLEQQAAGKWSKVPARALEGIVQPLRHWRRGEVYRITLATGCHRPKQTREFAIGPPVHLQEGRVGLLVENKGRQPVRFAAGGSCSLEHEAQLRHVVLKLPRQLEPYAAAVQVQQSANGRPWRHRTSLCSKPDRLHVLPEDRTFVVATRCDPADVPLENGKTGLRYEFFIAGSGIALPDATTTLQFECPERSSSTSREMSNVTTERQASRSDAGDRGGGAVGQRRPDSGAETLVPPDSSAGAQRDSRMWQARLLWAVLVLALGLVGAGAALLWRGARSVRLRWLWGRLSRFWRWRGNQGRAAVHPSASPGTASRSRTLLGGSLLGAGLLGVGVAAVGLIRGAPELAVTRIEVDRGPAMILIPGGFIADKWRDGDSGLASATSAAVPGFFLDQTEVTAGQYAECVLADQCTPPPRSRECNDDSGDRFDHPVNCVRWDEAAQFCRWAGKRLPRANEWRFAAGLGLGHAFAWGDDEPDSGQLCWRRTVDARTCAVATHPESRSPWGVHDMAGNVCEWTAATNCDSNQRDCEGSRVCRGGSWRSEAAHEVGADAKRSLPRTGTSSDVGFRCASSLDPLDSGDDVVEAARRQLLRRRPSRRLPTRFRSRWGADAGGVEQSAD
jgi:formylglycine-generating enzyme required for sulfatase activity